MAYGIHMSAFSEATLQYMSGNDLSQQCRMVEQAAGDSVYERCCPTEPHGVAGRGSKFAALSAATRATLRAPCDGARAIVVAEADVAERDVVAGLAGRPGRAHLPVGLRSV